MTDAAPRRGALGGRTCDGAEVIAPSFKRRLSGVTASVVRLVPVQARDIAIVAVGPNLPRQVPQIRLRDLVRMSREGPSGARVWHARRNVEMLGGLALKHLLGLRLKLVFTSASQREHKALTRALIRRMDAVVATSAKSAAYLEREAMVVPHGIDTDGFRPPPDKAALKRELGLPPGPLVGCYGRIRRQKGTDLFVETMIGALRTRPEASAIVMGRAVGKDAGFERALREKVARTGLAERILFLPEAPTDGMARWYQVLDLLVAPQRWEGFGLTPLEAMACGVPVVAARVGAFEEMIVEGETGHVVPPGDAAALEDAVGRLLDDAERLRRFSGAAREHMLADFPIEREAAALNRLYRQLLCAGDPETGPQATAGDGAVRVREGTTVRR